MAHASSLALPISLDRGLSAYLRAVSALPVLNADEERELALRFRNDNDLEAARTLVMANLRHVPPVARSLKGYGLPQGDLIQEGNIGLMKAAKHFDPLRGVRLMSFAIHWIRAEIYEHILRNFRIVRMATTKAQKKLFFNLRKSRARIGWMTDDETRALAARLDVAPEQVSAMEARLSSPDMAFDRDDDDEDAALAPADWLADRRFDPERINLEADTESARVAQLGSALEALDARARTIISRRWLGEDKATLHDLAAEFGVSAERVRQIEANALKKLRSHLVA